MERDLVIVGGGPAGMVAGLLFARAGCRTTLLEKHDDFLRDFRGDTVHPSTLRIFHELGLLDRLLARHHDKVPDISAHVGGRRIVVADFSGFDPRWSFIALMPQWDFLDFVAEEARKYPNFELLTGAEATGLVRSGDRVTGVAFRQEGEAREISAKLVIAADGRRSVLRADSHLPLKEIGAPMDVFWFRVPKERTPVNETTGVFAAGRIMALIDRGDYWQCAYVFAKGEAEAIRARGLDAFRADIARTAPFARLEVSAISGWDDVKLLTVALDRLECWDRPGLLVIGDAAHAMSPIGGVGINVAVQDAVAAANILAGPLAAGEDVDPLLRRVEKRRLLAVRATQAFQNTAQKRIISRLLQATGPVKPIWPLRMLDRFPLLRRIPAAFLGFGLKAEHVRSPEALR
ncbi:MAG: FAD-dependent oxidoreductase [Alphaproteobacteria bacterium]|nr:FAD-dependent oxidoreductase [Alphaproteobacteria bacterium]